MPKDNSSKTEQIILSLIETAKKNFNEISLSEVNQALSDAKINDSIVSEVYDRLEKEGISIVDSKEPTEFDLVDVDVNDVLDDDYLDDDLLLDTDDEDDDKIRRDRSI